jgi:hypothetical protein
MRIFRRRIVVVDQLDLLNCRTCILKTNDPGGLMGTQCERMVPRALHADS